MFWIEMGSLANNAVQLPGKTTHMTWGAKHDFK